MTRLASVGVERSLMGSRNGATKTGQHRWKGPSLALLTHCDRGLQFPRLFKQGGVKWTLRVLFLCKKRLAMGGDDLLYLLLKGYKEKITEKTIVREEFVLEGNIAGSTSKVSIFLFKKNLPRGHLSQFHNPYLGKSDDSPSAKLSGLC